MPVPTARTFEPQARPAANPEGASSTTRPERGRGQQTCLRAQDRWTELTSRRVNTTLLCPGKIGIGVRLPFGYIIRRDIAAEG